MAAVKTGGKGVARPAGAANKSLSGGRAGKAAAKSGTAKGGAKKR